MRFVSPLLKHVLYPTLYHSGLLDHVPPLGTCAVVNYHGVIPSDHSSSDVFLDGNLLQPEVFLQQLRFLKAHYEVIEPEDFLASLLKGQRLPKRAVLLTCDDGLLNCLTDMLPALQSEHVSCLFLVTGASCSENPGMLWYEELYLLMQNRPLQDPGLELPGEAGSEFGPLEPLSERWWSTVKRASQLDERSRDQWMRMVRSHCGPLQMGSERRWRLLNISELKELADAGMCIGAHTLSHPVLSLCSENEARREIQQSKLAIERALGRTIWALAYPFGNPGAVR